MDILVVPIKGTSLFEIDPTTLLEPDVILRAGY